jgi:RND family efflux transporter MFP subunit
MFALGAGGLSLSVLALAGCGEHGAESVVKADAAPKPVPVSVAPLVHRTVERTVEVVGTLKGWEDVTLGTKKEGRVVRVRHDMGDRVKPGELLVELDPVDADLSIREREERVQAELAKLGLKDLPKKAFDVRSVPSVVQAEVALEKAKQNHTRERSLNKRGAGTAQDLQNAENDERGAEAALGNAILTAQATLANARASRAAVDVARQSRHDTEIRAPVPSALPPGVTGPLEYAVAKRSVSEGQMLKQGEAVVELVIENPLRLWTNVPERFTADIALGQPVRVVVASYPGATFEGKVARINPVVDSVSRTFQVEVAIPNSRGLLRPGGFAKASIVTDHSAEAAAVPIESVVKFAGVTKLFVVEGDRARSINVETGIEGSGWVEVIGALPKDARVVTEGQTQLADGTAVVLRKPETAGSPAKPTRPAAVPGPSGE